jgi:hypothetical protein
MIQRVLAAGALLAWLTPTLASSAFAQFRLEKHDGGVRVYEADKMIADYAINQGPKPIVWPLLGPDGEKMTRDYPMIKDSQNEAHDHPHHRSLWFTHGEVNGIDFWAEGEKMGRTEHQEYTKLADGKTAVIATKNLWNSPSGETVLSDRRRYTFSNGPDDSRILDCEFELIASHGDVHFGDTKEGTFALRIAESMKVDAKKGGQIVNSEGDTDGKAWGKAAEWVDYHGPIGDKTLGIAILCHPSTFHHPNRWHVRTYGLFGANPFGVAHFENKKEMTDGTRLKKGDSLVFRYRVILHKGNEKDAKIADQFQKYAAEKFEAL